MCIFDNEKFISNDCSSIVSTEEIVSYFMITQFSRERINTDNSCRECGFSDKDNNHPHFMCKVFIAVDEDEEELIFEEDIENLFKLYEYTHYMYEVQVYFCENCECWYIDYRCIIEN